MAPLPKKKHAKSRTRRRKSTKKMTLPKLVTCPKCGNLRLPHRACPKCGYYGNEDKKRPQTQTAN